MNSFVFDFFDKKEVHDHLVPMVGVTVDATAVVTVAETLNENGYPTPHFVYHPHLHTVFQDGYSDADADTVIALRYSNLSHARSSQLYHHHHLG